MDTETTTRKLTGNHCQCPRCGLYFNSVHGFDHHRVGDYTDRRCLGPDELRAMGWSLNAGGWWITSKMPERIRGQNPPAQMQT